MFLFPGTKNCSEVGGGVDEINNQGLSLQMTHAKLNSKGAQIVKY